jgi:succinoglycan biosynthesis protein ExoM
MPCTPAFNTEPIVSIIIPTFRRNDTLFEALSSLVSQRKESVLHSEVIVVDNSPELAAQDVVKSFDNVVYISEKAPGVASARNAGVRAARGRYILFLVDDETASRDWLRNMLDCLCSSSFSAVFGPVHANAEEPRSNPEMIRFFERRLGVPNRADITRYYAYLGTGNSGFRAESLRSAKAPFDTAMNETGGEDSLLIASLVASGGRLGWAAEAIVQEHVPPTRYSWDYIRKRSFLNGQIRTFVAARAGRYGILAAAWWMLVGAAQATLYLSQGLFSQYLLRTAAHERCYAKAAGGAGKLLWFGRLRLPLYKQRNVP